MRLSELLERTFWHEMAAQLRRYYPDFTATTESFECAFRQLLTLAPTPSKLTIFLCWDGADSLPAVVGREPGTDGPDYALEYQPWDEWLGMRVAAASLETYGLAGVAAHCLFEMTLLGYSQTEVLAERRSLLARVEGLCAAPVQRQYQLKALTKACQDVQRGKPGTS